MWLQENCVHRYIQIRSVSTYCLQTRHAFIESYIIFNTENCRQFGTFFIAFTIEFAQHFCVFIISQISKYQINSNRSLKFSEIELEHKFRVIVPVRSINRQPIFYLSLIAYRTFDFLRQCPFLTSKLTLILLVNFKVQFHLLSCFYFYANVPF